MLRVMKSSKSAFPMALAALLVAGGATMVLGEAKLNPYQAISERNAFGLKDAPPPPENTPPPPLVPQSKVILTGTTSMLGITRALLEITETEPGKAGTVRKPILREGERDGAIEVVSINIEQSLVKIRNAGLEASLSFEAPKLTGTGSPPAPVPGGIAAPPPALSANVGGNHPGKAGGVPVYGNTAAAGVANAAAGTRAVVQAPYGSGAGAMPGAGAGGLRSIPSRSVRIEGSAPSDAARQYLNMAIQHDTQTGAGQSFPPLPPVPGDPAVQAPSQ